MFAPIDDHFPDDTPLISSGFRVIPLDMKTVKHCQRHTFSIYFFPLFRQLLGFLVAIILSRLSFAIIQNGSLICYNLIRIKCKIVHLPLHILFWMIVYSAQIIICLDFCLFLFSAWHIFPILLFKDSHFCHWAWGILIFFQKKKEIPSVLANCNL